MFVSTYCLMRKSRRLLIPYWYPWAGALWLLGLEDFATFGHLPEYPTCSKAMSWCGALCTMNITGSIEPSLQYGSVSLTGFLFFHFCIWGLSVRRPFAADWVWGRIIPKLIFGFPETLHRTVLSYYGRQIGEACNFMTIDGVQYSLVRAIIAED